MKYGKLIDAILLFLVLGIVTLALPPQIARAATLTVDDDGPADYSTIQDAINTASTGDVITVSPGTYNENLTISDKEITLQSDPNDPTATVINGGGTGRTISFNNAGVSVLEGFTITGGTDSGLYTKLSSPTIMRCIFTNNTGSSGYGGGLYSDNSSPTIVNNIFYANTGDDLYLLDSIATVVNNTLYNTNGSGIKTLHGSAVIANNIIYFQRDYGIYYYVAPGISHFITIRHNLVNVKSVDYFNPNGSFPTVINDIKANPQFVDPGNADFHLEGTSACINAGDNNMVPSGIDEDFEGNNRIADGTVDMGAYEHADLNPPAAPTNLMATAGDKQVDLDWDDNAEVDLNGYNVYRSQTSGGTYTKVNGSPLSSSNYTDTGLTGGVTYYYVVTAVDLGSNESGYSVEASATPTDSTPPPPSPPADSARVKKEAAVEALENAKGDDSRLNRRIDRVQLMINTSLNDDWWQDDSRLDSRLGRRVFDRELVAALALEAQSRLYDRLLPALERIIAAKERRGRDVSQERTRQQAIELALSHFEDALICLASADQVLAGVALDDAGNTPVSNPRFERYYHRYLEMAQRYMDRANASLDDGNATRAIRYYRSAWNYAQQAIRYASRS